MKTDAFLEKHSMNAAACGLFRLLYLQNILINFFLHFSPHVSEFGTFVLPDAYGVIMLTK